MFLVLALFLAIFAGSLFFVFSTGDSRPSDRAKDAPSPPDSKPGGQLSTEQFSVIAGDDANETKKRREDQERQQKLKGERATPGERGTTIPAKNGASKSGQ